MHDLFGFFVVFCLVEWFFFGGIDGLVNSLL